jgi:hypothetical protein
VQVPRRTAVKVCNAYPRGDGARARAVRGTERRPPRSIAVKLPAFRAATPGGTRPPSPPSSRPPRAKACRRHPAFYPSTPGAESIGQVIELEVGSVSFPHVPVTSRGKRPADRFVTLLAGLARLLRLSTSRMPTQP